MLFSSLPTRNFAKNLRFSREKIDFPAWVIDHSVSRVIARGSKAKLSPNCAILSSISPRTCSMSMPSGIETDGTHRPKVANEFSVGKSFPFLLNRVNSASFQNPDQLWKDAFGRVRKSFRTTHFCRNHSMHFVTSDSPSKNPVH
jgi:hypothetical protein